MFVIVIVCREIKVYNISLMCSLRQYRILTYKNTKLKFSMDCLKCFFSTKDSGVKIEEEMTSEDQQV